VKTLIDASRTTCEAPATKIKQIKQFAIIHTLHRTPYERIRKIITKIQRALEKLESFDPVTREWYRLPPVKILTHSGTTKSQQKIREAHSSHKKNDGLELLLSALALSVEKLLGTGDFSRER
jgi:hypothetical protein